MRTPAAGYVFDNSSSLAEAHHAALAELLDQATQRRLSDLLDLTGADCLEVAAGAGSIATWLADRVGPFGQVLATDTKPHLIPVRSRLTVLQHDITTGPPGAGYDLVHARLLLNHLPRRRQVLHQLAEAVRPGGVLVTEDFWPTPPNEFVACALSVEDATLVRRYQLAHLQVLADHGNDRTWSRRALLAFLEEGLVDVHTTVHGGTWRGGGPGCRLLIAGLGQLRDELIAAGLTLTELDHLRALFSDPSLVLHGHLLYSTSGRRPPTMDSR
jgi:SAM-dependent methyltransferase